VIKSSSEASAEATGQFPLGDCLSTFEFVQQLQSTEGFMVGRLFVHILNDTAKTV